MMVKVGPISVSPPALWDISPAMDLPFRDAASQLLNFPKELLVVVWSSSSFGKFISWGALQCCRFISSLVWGVFTLAEQSTDWNRCTNDRNLVLSTSWRFSIESFLGFGLHSLMLGLNMGSQGLGGIRDEIVSSVNFSH